MGALERALGWLDGQADEARALLGSLVRVGSFTGHREGGNEVGRLLRAAFEGPDLACEAVASERYADHLVFTTPAPGRRLALVGHLDTVHPPGGFEGFEVEGGVARGPGVLDMKGGLVVTGLALAALRAGGLLAKLPLVWVVVSDEEVGSPESQPLLLARAGDAVAALVFEAGRPGDAIVTRRKGTGTVTALAEGRAAHAGTAHAEGVSAIWALARFVDRVQRLTDAARGVTVNVGTFVGGDAKNTVAERAQAGIDVRFVHPSDGDAVMVALHEAALDAAASVPGARIVLRGGISRAPLERTSASVALAEAYGACARASGLGDGEADLSGGGSDANTLAAAGVATIDGLGPRGSGLHTRDEQIVLSTLLPKAAAVVRLLAPRGGG